MWLILKMILVDFQFCSGVNEFAVKNGKEFND